jgi:hypothetical protein
MDLERPRVIMLPRLSIFLLLCVLVLVRNGLVLSQYELRNVKWEFNETFTNTNAKGDNVTWTVSKRSEHPSLGRCVFFDYSETGKVWCIRRKEHIVFVGDSLSRFQYLALVYAVHFGRPLKNNGAKEDSITWLKNGVTWSEFLAKSTALFSPYMKCDCQRANKALYLHEMNENRYYYHPQWDISLTYIASFGTAAMLRGQWAPPTSKYASRNVDFLPNPVNNDFIPTEFVWELGEPEAYEEIIGHLEPKPTVIMTNRGLHGEVSRGDIQAVYDAAKRVTNCTIWKTTTPPGMEYRGNFKGKWPVVNDEEARAIFDIIVDTKHVVDTLNFANDDHMWDHHHFYGHVYNFFNEELLRVLSEKCSFDGQYVETAK